MPFQARIFQEKIETLLTGAPREELRAACQEAAAAKTPVRKAACLRKLMLALERAADAETRREILEACGRNCTGASVLKRARQIQKSAQDLDDLLRRLNEAHIGGGSLRREGSIIHAAYARCCCGSVSQAREPVPALYCACSCGWFRALFETLLGRPVEVELAGSILQGDDCCRFRIDPGQAGRWPGGNLEDRAG